MADIFDIASFFIDSSNVQEECITNLKLNKLLYFAQAWCLVKYDRPLFDEPIEAWELGPVINKVYQKYKKFGKKTINCIDNENYSDSLSNEDQDVLVDVMLNFGKYTAASLVNLSHARGGPWDTAHNRQGEISLSIMKEYFKAMYPKTTSVNACQFNADIYVPNRDSNGNALVSKEVYDNLE